MAQPNVAREPSMEEILASIRRIIESNDPTSDAAALRPSPASFDADDEIDDGLDFGPAIAANDVGMPVRAEERLQPVAAAMPVSSTPAVAPPERSLSLADVAARVRAASARQLEAHRAGTQAPAPQPAPAPQVVAPVASAPVAPAMPAPERKEMDAPRYEPFSAPVAATVPEAEVAPVRDESVMAPLQIAELPMPELRPTMSDTTLDAPEVSAEQVIEDAEEAKDHSEAEAVSADKPAGPQFPVAMDAFAGLLSEAAGAQVAKSFGELAEVFDGLERRSVEEMAEDMLRPMLQDWLDDNLPTLVERLVREEIERVARGPRR